MNQSGNTLQQLMFSLIEVWKSSGRTQIEFCKEKGIAYPKFHYWFKKYNTQGIVSKAESFSQIPVSSASIASGSIEVLYPDGRRLIFNQQVDAVFLRNLLA